jgi:murein DD-endopeptidase MepM/ murein hydrolase activator NlpD
LVLNFSRFLLQALHQSRECISSMGQWMQRHPRHVLASVSVVLLGTGATAFAVATLVPDPSTVPVRQVLERVEPIKADAPQFLLSNPELNAAPNAATAATTAPAPFILYRSDLTRGNESADALLRRLGVADAAVAAYIRNDTALRTALLSRPGRNVTAEVDAQHALVKLTVRWTADETPTFQRLVLERKNDALSSRLETAPLVASTRLGSAIIRSSLFAATDDARIPDAVAVQIAEIFSGDIDFYRALRKGDRFNVVYESLEADGEPLRSGRVLSAEFFNGGKKFEAVWFQENGKAKGQYYTLSGNSLRKAFLASPLEFSRMTSGFGGRMHPIARQFRMHNGVDYAAPTGTPIRTVGDGVVAFAGVQRGYGNVVEIMHRDGKSTLYAHMSRIDVRVGQTIEQGSTIGAVGSTGWSTGPHLHFEFRINGVHHDPMLIAQQSDTIPLSSAARPVFDRMAATMRRDLTAAASVSVASAQ